MNTIDRFNKIQELMANGASYDEAWANSGTSEGVKKSWRSRQLKHVGLSQQAESLVSAIAHKKSASAYEFSQDADKAKDDIQESHIVAEGKHRDAYTAHKTAGRNTEEGSGQQAHFSHADEHLAAANYHKQKAAGAA